MYSSQWGCCCSSGGSGRSQYGGPRRSQYGAAPANIAAEAIQEDGSGSYISQFFSDVAPHLEAYTAVAETVSDPARQIAVLESQITAARQRGASLRELQLLQGKLTAAQIRLQRRQETDMSVRTWRSLGMLASVTGIALTASLVLFVLTRVLR